ncbi:hypothetical protein K2Z83_15715 [Oscillochloris sp. ZM17-4]|jgi:hypothetical protein|uniref:hypothetical protein n=1 Tax=Oscillochloris sp. ZM17-4 TaxID=2866714 RepID=UPI001C72C193|nr:hypothetical protein [Oscillochloris sp. ZM17-4]MBX0329125.1 hypothetical protein [Oscillochloris sp. ZM17-4]
MADTSVTLALDGDISLEDFSLGIRRLSELLRQLATDLAPKDDVSYSVAELEASSAISTFAVNARTPDAGPLLVRAYHSVGEALAAKTHVPYGPKIRKAAQALADVAERPSVQRLRFQTHLGDFAITPRAKEPVRELPTAISTVRGTIQTLTNRRGLRFILYDTLFDRPVACYLSERDEDLMRNAWGKHATVEGVVTRDPETWRPLAVRHITHVTIAEPVAPDAYRQARGALPFGEGDPPAEKLVRSLRDGD